MRFALSLIVIVSACGKLNHTQVTKSIPGVENRATSDAEKDSVGKPDSISIPPPASDERRSPSAVAGQSALPLARDLIISGTQDRLISATFLFQDPSKDAEGKPKFKVTAQPKNGSVWFPYLPNDFSFVCANEPYSRSPECTSPRTSAPGVASFWYVAYSNFVGEDSFEYVVQTSAGESTAAKVRVTVSAGVDDPPTRKDLYTIFIRYPPDSQYGTLPRFSIERVRPTPLGEPVASYVEGVAAYDPDMDPVSIEVLQAPRAGSFSIVPDTQPPIFRYQPKTKFFPEDDVYRHDFVAYRACSRRPDESNPDTPPKCVDLLGMFDVAETQDVTTDISGNYSTCAKLPERCAIRRTSKGRLFTSPIRHNVTFDEAESICVAGNFGGEKGWHLPPANEIADRYLDVPQVNVKLPTVFWAAVSVRTPQIPSTPAACWQYAPKSSCYISNTSECDNQLGCQSEEFLFVVSGDGPTRQTCRVRCGTRDIPRPDLIWSYLSTETMGITNVEANSLASAKGSVFCIK